MATTDGGPWNVMFLQSQTHWGSDCEMHANIMRNLDRDHWAVHVALGDTVPSEAPQSAYRHTHELEDVTIHPMNFGPQRNDLPGLSYPARAMASVRLVGEMVKLARYVRKHHIRTIHGTEKPRDAVTAVVVAKMAGAKSVVHLHVGWDTWITREVQWALRNADAVIAVSEFVRETAVSKGGVRPERCHVILNGIDATTWHPDTDPQPVRAEFGISDDDVVFGIFSRMSVWKGHLDLAQAFGRVAPTIESFKVLVVGADDPRSAPGRRPLSEELRELTDELGISDRFLMTGWRTDIENLMAAVDVYAMPTFEEPCAVAFLEAMAMAKPIVAIVSGGTPEIVPDPEIGLLADSGDIQGLADRLVVMIQEPERRRTMGENARQYVANVRTARQMAIDADGIYRRLIADA